MELVNKKEEKLINILKAYKRVVIGYSGGVDSTYLAFIAQKVLGDDCLCVTLSAEIHSKREIEESISFAKANGIKQNIISVSVLDLDFFKTNPPDRCYHCKKVVFNKIKQICIDGNYKYTLDGTNTDDLQDYRPGMRAIEELEVKSPLFEAGLSKNDIRILSKKHGLNTFDKPSFACLASRIPYNQSITLEKVERIEAGENFLFDKGFKQLRVRHLDNLCRIEVAREERSKLFDEKLLDEIDDFFKKLGFIYVTIEVSGYKTGSLNIF